MELMVLLVLLAVIGLALCWPRSERERMEQERAREEWARDHKPPE